MFIRMLFLFFVGHLLASSVAANENDIVITQIASATHPVPRENTRGAAIGFNAFFSRVNAGGGIQGRKVSLEAIDDRFDPAETVKLVEQTIKESRSLALFATVGTANLAELVKKEALVRGEIALVAPVSGLPELLGASNVYPVRANYIDELHAIVKHSGTIMRKRAVFIHLDTPLATKLQATLAAGLKEDGRELIDSVAVVPVSDPEQMANNVRISIDKAFKNAPDMCIVFGPGPIAPKVLEEVRKKFGQQPTIYVMSVSSAPDLIRMAGIKNAFGTIISQALPLPSDLGNRSVRQYMADMKKYAPNEALSHLSLEGYLGAWLLYEGMKRAGPVLNRASLLASLNAIGRLDLGDFEVDFSPRTKRGSARVDMTLISKNGQLIH